MILAGLDLNATWARAVGGADGEPPRMIELDAGDPALPMALSLQERRVQVGRPGAALRRELPHLACLDFLSQLEKPRTWTGGRHRLDAARALALVLEHLRPALANARSLVFALPAYLSASQAATVLALAHRARLPVGGSVASPLALGLTAHAEQSWTGPAVIVEADDHALTRTILKAGPGRLQVLETTSFPHLSLAAWKGRVLDAIAEWCIRHTRRDPRDSGAAEQHLYDQLDGLFEAEQQDQMAEVIVQTASWCQNLFLQPQQVRAFCAPLVDQALHELGSVLEGQPSDAPAALLVTAEAGRLPGLFAALKEAAGDAAPVRRLAPEAGARGAHAVAARMRWGHLPHGHLDASLPLPAAEPHSGPRLAVEH